MWERYTYPGEEFSVELPLMPLVFNTSRSISRTESEKMRVFGVYSGGLIFIVTSYDKPRSHELLDYFATYHWGGRGLAPKGEVALGGFKGKEYEPSDSLHGLARVFRTKKHAYLVWALTTEENQPSVERFLNSFMLSARPSGKAVADDAPVPAYNPPPTPSPGTQQGAGAVAAVTLPPPDERPADGPFTQKEVVRKALIVYKPAPGFTEEARKNNVVGVVRMRAILSSTGRVTGISIIKSLPDGLTEKAIRAARHMLFFPAQKDGREVSQYIILEYNFNIY